MYALLLMIWYDMCKDRDIHSTQGTFGHFKFNFKLEDKNKDIYVAKSIGITKYTENQKLKKGNHDNHMEWVINAYFQCL